MRSRTEPSIAAPTLCTVVKPPCSVIQAFSAVYSAASSGLSPPADRLVIRVEVPVEVDVGVDPAGHDGEAAQIVGGRRASGRDGSRMVDPSMTICWLRSVPPLPSRMVDVSSTMRCAKAAVEISNVQRRAERMGRF